MSSSEKKCDFKAGRIRKYAAKKNIMDDSELKRLSSKIKDTQTNLLGKILSDRPRLIEYLIHGKLLDFPPIIGYTTMICLPMIDPQTINHCLDKMLTVVINLIAKEVTDDSKLGENFENSERLISNFKKLGFKIFWLVLSSLLCRYINVNDKLLDVSFDGIFLEKDNAMEVETSDKQPNKFNVLKYQKYFEDSTEQHFIQLFSLRSMIDFKTIMMKPTSIRRFEGGDITGYTIDDIVNGAIQEEGISFKAYQYPEYVIKTYLQKQEPFSNEIEGEKYSSEQYEELSRLFPFIREHIPSAEEMTKMKDFLTMDHRNYVGCIHMLIFLKGYIWNRHWMETIKRRLMFGFESENTTDDLKDCDEYDLTANKISREQEVEILKGNTTSNTTRIVTDIPIIDTIQINTGGLSFYTQYVETPKDGKLPLHIIDAIVIRNNTVLNGIPWFTPGWTTKNIKQLWKCSIIENFVFSAQRYLLPEVVATFFCRIVDIPKVNMKKALDHIQVLEEWYRAIGTSTKSNIYHDFPFDFRINGNSNIFYEDIYQFNELGFRNAISTLVEFIEFSLTFEKKDKNIDNLYKSITLQNGSILHKDDIVMYLKSYIDRLHFIIDIVKYQQSAIKTFLIGKDDRILFSQPVLYIEKNVNISDPQSQVLTFTIEIAEHELEGRLKGNLKCEGTVHGCKLKLVILIPSQYNMIDNRSKFMPSSSSTVDGSNHSFYGHPKIVFSDSDSYASILEKETDRLSNLNKNKIEQERLERNMPKVAFMTLGDTPKSENTPPSQPNWDGDLKPITVIVANAKAPYFMNDQYFHEFGDHLIKISWHNFATNIHHKYVKETSSKTTNFNNLANRVGIAFMNVAILCPFIAFVFDEFRNSDMRTQNPNPEKFMSLFSVPKAGDLTAIPGRVDFKGPAFHYNQILYTGSFNSHTSDDPLNYHMLMVNYLKSKRLERHCKQRLAKIGELINTESQAEKVDTKYVNYLKFDETKQRKILDFLSKSNQCIHNTLDIIITMNPTDWIFADNSKYNFGTVTGLIVNTSDRKDETMKIITEFYNTISSYQKIKQEILAIGDQHNVTIETDQKIVSGIISKATVHLESYFMDKINILRTFDKKDYMKSLEVAEKSFDLTKQRSSNSREDYIQKFRARFRPDDETRVLNEHATGAMYQQVISTHVAQSTKEAREVYLAQQSSSSEQTKPVQQPGWSLSGFFSAIPNLRKQQNEPDVSNLSPEEVKQFKTLTPDGKKIYLSMRTNKRRKVDEATKVLNQSIIEEDQFFNAATEQEDISGKIMSQAREYKDFGGPAHMTDVISHQVQKSFMQNEMSENIMPALFSRLPGMTPNLLEDPGIKHMYSKLKTIKQ